MRVTYLALLVWSYANAALAADPVVLHRGGEFDFEAGFTMHRPSILPGREYDEVGTGWGYWGQPALFMPPADRYGRPNFNGNRFPPNVSSQTFSQEITMTSANGDAIVWKTFAVPVGHRIRCTFDAITTPSEDNLQLRHAVGQGGAIDFFGQEVTDPFAVGLDWRNWDIDDTNNHFATCAVSATAEQATLTYYLWVRHAYATSTGATLCVDNLVVYDDGVPADPSVLRSR